MHGKVRRNCRTAVTVHDQLNDMKGGGDGNGVRISRNRSTECQCPPSPRYGAAYGNACIINDSSYERGIGAKSCRSGWIPKYVVRRCAVSARDHRVGYCSKCAIYPEDVRPVAGESNPPAPNGCGACA